MTNGVKITETKTYQVAIQTDDKLEILDSLHEGALKFWEYVMENGVPLVQQMEKEIIDLKFIIDSKNDEIHKLHQHVDSINVIRQDLDTDIIALRHDVEVFEQQIVDKDQEIARLTRLLEEKTEEISGLHDMVIDLESQISLSHEEKENGEI